MKVGTTDIRVGDIIYQCRHPGGRCLVVNVFHEKKEYDQSIRGWRPADYPILRILHPGEGLIDDPSYYYEEVPENETW